MCMMDGEDDFGGELATVVSKGILAAHGGAWKSAERQGRSSTAQSTAVVPDIISSPSRRF